MSESGAQGVVVQCPFCAEPIRPEAIMCRWCRSDLRPQPQGIPVYQTLRSQTPTAQPHLRTAGSQKQITIPCSRCGVPTTHNQRVPNHALHIILSLITAGFWLLIWLLIVLNKAPAQCIQCGSLRRA